MKTRILVLLSMVALMMVMLTMAVASAFAHTLTGSGDHSMTPKGIHHCIHEHPNQAIHHCIHQHMS